MDQMAKMAAFNQGGRDRQHASFSAAARKMQVSPGARQQADPGAKKLAFRVSDRAEHRA